MLLEASWLTSISTAAPFELRHPLVVFFGVNLQLISCPSYFDQRQMNVS